MAGWQDDPVVAAAPVRKSGQTPSSAYGIQQGKNDAKTVTELENAARSANDLAQSSADFMAKNAQTTTGGVLGWPGVGHVVADLVKANPELGDALGIKNPQNIGAMQRAAVGMATALKSKDMRLTQGEFMKFLGASPQIGTDYKGNLPIAHDVGVGRTLLNAQASFMRAWADSHGGTLNGAPGAWMEFRNSHFSPDASLYYHNGDAMQQGEPQAAAAPAATVFARQKAGQTGASVKTPSGTAIDVWGNPVRP
jgi:hypothetical protein